MPFTAQEIHINNIVYVEERLESLRKAIEEYCKLFAISPFITSDNKILLSNGEIAEVEILENKKLGLKDYLNLLKRA